MITGTGIDIIEIERIQRIIARWELQFINRIFNLHEIEYCEGKKEFRFHSYAGYFAAKEAMAKALGTGIFGIKWKEIKIKKDNIGKPFIILLGNAREIANKKLISRIHLSISHSQKYAIAFVVTEGKLEI